jgi:hypothetical protein
MVAIPASAQGPLEQQPTEERPFPYFEEDSRRLGPLLVRPELTIRNVGYDDNIFTSKDNETSDFTGELLVGATAQLRLSHRAAISVREVLGVEVFVRNSDQSNINNNTQLRGDLLLGAVLFSALGEWDKRNLTPGSELDQRPERDRLRAGLETWWFVSNRTDLSVGVESTVYRYADPDFESVVRAGDENGDGDVDASDEFPVDIGELLDHEETATTLRFRWKGLPRTRLSLELRDTEYEFDEERLLRDAEDQRVGLGVETVNGRAWDGRIHLGQVTFRPDEEGMPDYQGLYGDARLRLRILDRLEIPLRYERDLEFSTFDNIPYYIRDRTSLETRVHLRRNWLVLGGIAVGHARYPSEGTVIFRDEVRRDKIVISHVGFGFRIGSAWEVEVRVGVREQESNYDPADDRQFFVRNGLRRRF